MKDLEKFNFSVDIIADEVEKRLRPMFGSLEKKVADATSRERSSSTRLFSVADASVYLGVAPKTIRRKLKSGELKGKKVGDHWRIDVKELDRILRRSVS